MPKPRKTVGSRNPTLAQGVNKFGRSASYHRSGRYKVKNLKGVAKAAVAPATTKSVTFGKGKRNVPLQKATRFYPTEDVKTPLYSRKTARPTKVRASLQAGTVAIVLAGPNRGKRVVVLKTLPSGLLLVTGPYKINGVPLRRINPAYVIATSTKVDVAAVKVDAKLNDEYFRRPAAKKAGDKLFAEAKAGEKKPKNVIAESRKADQKAVDAGVLAAVKKVPQLTDFLNAKFTLVRGQFPHEMKF